MPLADRGLYHAESVYRVPLLPCANRVTPAYSGRQLDWNPQIFAQKSKGMLEECWITAGFLIASFRGLYSNVVVSDSPYLCLFEILLTQLEIKTNKNLDQPQFGTDNMHITHLRYWLSKTLCNNANVCTCKIVQGCSALLFNSLKVVW